MISIDRETDIPAFIWDGAKLVPSDPRTIARRQEQLWNQFIFNKSRQNCMK